jgi:hypothetical protein
MTTAAWTAGLAAVGGRARVGPNPARRPVVVLSVPIPAPPAGVPVARRARRAKSGTERRADRACRDRDLRGVTSRAAIAVAVRVQREDAAPATASTRASTAENPAPGRIERLGRIAAQLRRQAAAVPGSGARQRALALHSQDPIRHQVTASLSGGDGMERRTAPEPHSALVGQRVTAALIGDVRGAQPSLVVVRNSADARAIGPATTPWAVVSAPPEKGASIRPAVASKTCGMRLIPAANPESWAHRSPMT